jgi:tryptophan-rich sensory protein
MGRQARALVGWLLLCLAASGTAVFVSTDGWYAGLNKASWNPPEWIFGPVWTLLNVLMAVAACLLWRTGGRRRRSWALGLFLLQWLLDALWTPLFFGMDRSGIDFAKIILVWLVLAATMRSFWWVGWRLPAELAGHCDKNKNNS